MTDASSGDAAPPLRPVAPSKQVHAETDLLPRIRELTGNARNTWFVLLGVLVFVGVTLMGVEDIDFFGAERATELPLVGVTVPTRLFFVVAPILTAAVYGYFHLYLIRLWHALGRAPPQSGGMPLGDCVPPWLVSDAALYLRWWRRREDPPCTTRRKLECPAALLNISLAWIAGIFVLAVLWWKTMPAHHLPTTAVAAVALLVALWVGIGSFAVMWRRMGNQCEAKRSGSRVAGVLALFAVSGIALGFVSVERTLGYFGLQQPISAAQYSSASWPVALLGLAPIDLAGEALVRRPVDWLPQDIARREFLHEWCQRESNVDCDAMTQDEYDQFESEWQTRRRAQLAALSKPNLNPLRSDRLPHDATDREALRRRAPDLRYGDLRGAFLGGMNLAMARLDQVNLAGAHMEGADLSYALLSGAILTDTKLEGAIFQLAQLEHAKFENAHLRLAIFVGADMPRANFVQAVLERADLSRAVIRGGDLHGARLSSAQLGGADLRGANLSLAELQGANLSDSSIEEADFRWADMRDTDLSLARMSGAFLSDANLQGSKLNQANLRGALLMRRTFRASISVSPFWKVQISEVPS